MIRGIKVKIPSNATVATTFGARTYSGVWDGTFAAATRTNGPAIVMSLLTNERYGVGVQNNRQIATFFAISQYCNAVDDGKGGQEPRLVAIY